MQTASPASRPQTAWWVRFTGFGGLGLGLGWLVTWIAEANGMLFGGVDAFVAAMLSGCGCAFGATIAAAILKGRGGSLPWQAGLVGALVLSFGTTSVVSLFSTRKNLEILMNPMPVPAELRVLRGQRYLHGMEVHFTAAPEAISALIRSKRLVEVPAEPGDENTLDISDHSARRQSGKQRSWWRPTSMPGAKFYYLHHKSQAIQGWAEGWWVNGATNEVYAFIGG